MAGTEAESAPLGKGTQPGPHRRVRYSAPSPRTSVTKTLTPTANPLKFHASQTCPRVGTPHPPNASPAAMTHIVTPTPTSSQTQAAGLAKTGASNLAPNPSAVKKLREAQAAATPNTA